MKKNARTKKLSALLLALATVAALFAACSSVSGEEVKNNAEPSAPETQKREDIVIAMESEAPTLHPFDHTSVTAGYMNTLTYNALFRTDPTTLAPVPDLCSEYSQLDDVTWSFKIYDNVFFHDGSHMTAEDVKASMEYARNYTTTKHYSSFWTNIEVTGEYTLTVTTDGPYALTLLDMASLKVVPKALIDSGNDFNLNPVGSGPYKFVSQSLGDRVEFEAFENYFDKAHQPKIKNMTWRIIPEGSSRTIALEAGEVDFVVEVETNDVARMKDDPTITVRTVSGSRMNYFSMNNEVYPFNNLDFRKAVNAAIDREAVLTVALNGEGKTAVGMCPGVFPGSSQENVEGYDPEKAKEYLAASGVDTEGLTFSCIVSNDTARRAAEVIQAYLAEIGLTMTIESMDYAAWLSDIMSGNYQVGVTGYTAVCLDRYLKGTFHSSALDAANQARCADAEVDSLIDLAMTQTDAAENEATHAQVTAKINALFPYVPLYESVVTRAYNAGLEGVTVGASGTVRFEDVYWKEN